MCELYNIVW